MKKPKNYYCHRNNENQSTVSSSSHFQIIEKIGEGSFGEVYKVFQPQTSKLMVIKKSKDSFAPGLAEEAQILKDLTNSTGFEMISDKSSLEKDDKCVVMRCLGQSTGTIMRRIKRMSIYSMKKIASQVIQKLGQLHGRHYVHRDLKPDNILFGDKYDAHSVYLIDFGLTATFKLKPNKIKKVYNGLIGTARFCSIASHEGFDQYPKDDLESFGYVLTYFIQGCLPWDAQQNENEEKLFDLIRQGKKKATIEQLCSGINCLRKYFSKVKGLKATDPIDYAQLRGYFSASNCQDCCFDFCENCWMKKSTTNAKEQIEISKEPKANQIRGSILS